jgi:hypothetical protein
MFTIAVVAFVCSTATAAQQEVTCESPCECSSAHGKGRWAVKNDPGFQKLLSEPDPETVYK